MASTILADNGVSSGSAGLKSSADSTGVLALQTTTSGGTATTAVTIDTAQNVGVGVTPSAWSSQKAIELPNGVALASYTAGVNIGQMFTNAYYNGTSYIYKNTDYAELYAQRQGQHIWYNAASGTAGNAISFTQAMTLDANGNLLVGTTTAPNATFLSKSNFIGLQTSNPADSTKWRQIVFANNSADATLYFPNGTNTATLSSAGAWTNASDARQKTNIVDIKYGLDTVLNVQPHSYNRTDVEGEFIGFVAQELKKIIPEVVFGSDETSYSVDYGSLVAVAFKAIQEQQAMIQTLTERITALEGAQA